MCSYLAMNFFMHLCMYVQLRTLPEQVLLKQKSINEWLITVHIDLSVLSPRSDSVCNCLILLTSPLLCGKLTKLEGYMHNYDWCLYSVY